MAYGYVSGTQPMCVCCDQDCGLGLGLGFDADFYRVRLTEEGQSIFSVSARWGKYNVK